jgi:hypothetical protein
MCRATLFTDSSILIFYLVCGGILLWNLVRGWRAGPARMAVAFGAIAAGYVAAIFAGELLVPPLRTLMGYPDIVLLGLGRIAVFLLAYFLVLGAGAVLFKRTSQQGIGLLRLLYGLSGAALGLLFGVCVVLAIVLAVRLAGALGEGWASSPESLPRAGVEDPSARTAGRLLATSLAWKNELEEGPIGPIVKAADPLPARDYEMLTKAGRVLGRAEATRRFLEAPSVKWIVHGARFQALQADGDIIKMATRRDYAGILRHPKMVEFLNDPAVINRLRDVDLESAFNYALAENPPPRP